MKTKIRNKIIAISGEPVSGKGTLVKNLIIKLKETGYNEENIHVISTGRIFRDLFAKIMELIKNSDNNEKLQEIGEDAQIRDILKNKEFRESLTKTIKQIKKEQIDPQSIDKISELNNSEILSEIRGKVDLLIDSETKRMGQEINKIERPNEIWIFDSRMAFSTIPEAFSVRLTISSKEAAKRLFYDSSRGEEDRYESLEEAERAREDRRIGEIKRYKEKYGVDLENPNNYNLLIDTSNVKFEEMKDVADKIIKEEEIYRNKLNKEIENR